MDLSAVRAMNRKLLRAGGLNVDAVIEEFEAIIEAESKQKAIVTPTQYARIKPKEKLPLKPGHSEIAAAAWSDWHLSECVRNEDSNGVNAYDSIIAANRVWELVQTQKQLFTIHKSLYNFDYIWIAILGDMINGSIHEELRLTNDLSDPAATILCARLLKLALLEIRQLGVPIRVDCVVGNHPRMTAKMPTKMQAQTSYDWLIYEMLADFFKDDKLVKINVHTSQLAIVEHYGWRYVVEHGIEWKNGAEESMEDRIRAVFDDPVYRQATGLEGASLDQVLIGNLHKPAFLERTIKNGSLTGQNELGQGWRLKPIPAQQCVWGISRKHVRTWQYQIDLTSIKDGNGDNPFVEYARGYMARHGRGNR